MPINKRQKLDRDTTLNQQQSTTEILTAETKLIAGEVIRIRDSNGLLITCKVEYDGARDGNSVVVSHTSPDGPITQLYSRTAGYQFERVSLSEQLPVNASHTALILPVFQRSVQDLSTGRNPSTDEVKTKSDKVSDEEEETKKSKNKASTLTLK